MNPCTAQLTLTLTILLNSVVWSTEGPTIAMGELQRLKLDLDKLNDDQLNVLRGEINLRGDLKLQVNAVYDDALANRKETISIQDFQRLLGRQQTNLFTSIDSGSLARKVNDTLLDIAEREAVAREDYSVPIPVSSLAELNEQLVPIDSKTAGKLIRLKWKADLKSSIWKIRQDARNQRISEVRLADFIRHCNYDEDVGIALYRAVKHGTLKRAVADYLVAQNTTQAST